MNGVVSTIRPAPRGGELGELLRGWRSARGRSQLDVSLDANMSQRHLSFVESGRSTPGRDKLLAIADALDIPLRERNALLLAAGYAPLYRDGSWDEPQMAGITAAAARLLRQQEPYPAVLMDRHWNVLSANAAAPRFFGLFIDMAERAGPRNILHLMFDPAGMRPFIRNWGVVAASLLGRVRREAVGGVLDPRSRELIEALLAYPGAPVGRAPLPSTTDLPMVPLSFERNGAVLSYFSMVCTVGTPTAVAAQELRVECMFPADQATEDQHLALMAPGTGHPWPEADEAPHP
ncbi:MAG: helix-turn-helix domain-containing protein [Janthinobacterium lividum]